MRAFMRDRESPPGQCMFLVHADDGDIAIAYDKSRDLFEIHELHHNAPRFHDRFYMNRWSGDAGILQQTVRKLLNAAIAWANRYHRRGGVREPVDVRIAWMASRTDSGMSDVSPVGSVLVSAGVS